ncbi:MAG: hypothetical protein A2017_16360 [Lentisphaerae bacterium GWF2_44_16]|nr:MAG: hypothetical protein A2017_16360 [Lentisphaerae bacterium GWF2_44_16]
MIPRDRDDVTAANELLELGFPEIAPILREMLYCLRVSKSPVADIFCNFFAILGSSDKSKLTIPVQQGRRRLADCSVVDAIASALSCHNTQESIRNRIVTDILPYWTKENIVPLTSNLSMIATWPDCLNSDLLSLKLLLRHNLVDMNWIRQWLQFKIDHLKKRGELIAEIQSELEI